MMRPCALVILAITTLTAADPAAVNVANEVAVIKILREQIFPAEIQTKSGAYQDFDLNGIGEYVFLAQLAGRMATSKVPLGRGNDTGLHMLTGPLATSLVANGYQFAAILPGGDHDLIVETNPAPVIPKGGVADQEKFFAAIAWPTAADQGTRSFLLMPDGSLRTAAYDGTPPDAAKAITYDSAKGEWTSSWQKADPRAMLERAQADIKNTNFKSALANIEWLWDNATAIDSSLYGVRQSTMRDAFFNLAKAYPPAMASYTKHKDDALANALKDLSDPSAQANSGMPQNHLNFLDYLSLAEKAETSKTIVANFKRIDAVNPALAKWEYQPVSLYLVQEGEFAYMNKFVPAWMEAELLITSTMLDDYRLDRMGVESKSSSMSRLVSKLSVIALVYQKNLRTTDALLMDTFVKIRLTDEEQRQLLLLVTETKNPRF